MSIEIKEASAEEILQFKKAAAARYAELGIEPKVAQQVFDRFMDKIANELGIQEIPVNDRIHKLADSIKGAMSCGAMPTKSKTKKTKVTKGEEKVAKLYWNKKELAELMDKPEDQLNDRERNIVKAEKLRRKTGKKVVVYKDK